ncbi:protein phosphatase 2C domain-containing protein [Streptomyces sp. NPDC059513]|uniref:protein phosphatase 2C domain-containing protein n=1 Tax=unclassified Streptomyces TaxID=2593676 RepID=UPI00368B164D
MAEFEPRPPSGLSYRPDTFCDGWSTRYLHMRLASVRGYEHRYGGRPREDDAAVTCDPASGAVVFAVADGVSAAEHPQIGAQLAARSAAEEMLSQLRAGCGLDLDWDRLLITVHWQLIEQARRIVHRPDAGPCIAEELLATTLVAGLAMPTRRGIVVSVVSVGDSGVWEIRHGRIARVIGGKLGHPDEPLSSAVDPMPRLPANGSGPHTFRLDPGTVVLVGTDGFGDALDDAGTGPVASLFIRELRRPVPPLRFAHLVDFSRRTFDDDRTLLALWPATDTQDGAGAAPHTKGAASRCR